MAGELMSIDNRLTTVWGDDTLLAPSSLVESPSYVPLATGDASYRELQISKVSSGGVYQLEICWSDDGYTPVITEIVPISDNMPQMRPISSKYARFRVRNTDAVNAFTVHRTAINAR